MKINDRDVQALAINAVAEASRQILRQPYRNAGHQIEADSRCFIDGHWWVIADADGKVITVQSADRFFSCHQTALPH